MYGRKKRNLWHGKYKRECKQNRVGACKSTQMLTVDLREEEEDEDDEKKQTKNEESTKNKCG